MHLNNESIEDSKERLIELVQELVKWIRVTSIPQVKKLLVEVLQKDEHKIAYHRSDGEQTREAIGGQVNVSGQAISNWWKKWERNGIVEILSVQGGTRGRKLFNLKDFDIQVPKLSLEESPNQSMQQTTQQEEVNNE